MHVAFINDYGKFEVYEINGEDLNELINIFNKISYGNELIEEVIYDIENEK